MKINKITSAQVAKLAGVSQSAVSRVFTKGASASKTTVFKVKHAADTLGYRPNSLARAMVSGKSYIIGVIVAYLENQFYPEALERLSNSLQARGYHVLIFMAGKNMENIDHVVEEILDYQVDGIIAASVALSSTLSERCLAANIPIVLFNRSQDNPSMSFVTSDNYAGGIKVGKFLIESGHTKIGYIAGWKGASTQRDREAGLRSILNSYDLDIFKTEQGNFVGLEARLATQRMLMRQIPTAIFVANDHMAFSVMDTIRYELNLKIPEDISIVGYDNVPASSWLSYSLTTVDQPVKEMVVKTVDLLVEKIEKPNDKIERVKIDGGLIIRGSTAELKGI